MGPVIKGITSLLNKINIKIYKILKSIQERKQLFLFLNLATTRSSPELFTHGKATTVLDIVTISYNHPHMTELQIQLIQKNIIDPFTHIIADNSNDYGLAQEIFNVCQKSGAEYVRIPKHPFRRNKSHAAAMHWTYKNVLKKRNTPNIGFLDHDIFPTQPTSIIQKMRNGIYGRPTNPYNQSGKWVARTTEIPFWSLWAGLYFIKTSQLARTNVYLLSFSQKFLKDGLYLDTGGGLWDTVYRHLPYPEDMIHYRSVQFRETDNSNIHTDYYEYYDDWIHIVNLSNWYATPDFTSKLKYFETLLNNLRKNEAHSDN